MGGIVVAALMIGGLAGCSGEEGNAPKVPEGQFEAEVEGTVDTTLTGRARYRLSDGRLSGIELAVDSARGLSIEVEPAPVGRRTYQVVEWELLQVERPGGAPGFVAFLEMPRGSFEATEGTLEITYVSGSVVGAVFDVEMEGALDGLPDDNYSVTAKGRLMAVPLGE